MLAVLGKDIPSEQQIFRRIAGHKFFATEKQQTLEVDSKGGFLKEVRILSCQIMPSNYLPLFFMGHFFELGFEIQCIHNEESVLKILICKLLNTF